MDITLELNVMKTKQILTDFRKAPTVFTDLFSDGMKVERESGYKYLGTVVVNKLNFNQTS